MCRIVPIFANCDRKVVQADVLGTLIKLNNKRFTATNTSEDVGVAPARTDAVAL